VIGFAILTGLFWIAAMLLMWRVSHESERAEAAIKAADAALRDAADARSETAKVQHALDSARSDLKMTIRHIPETPDTPKPCPFCKSMARVGQSGMSSFRRSCTVICSNRTCGFAGPCVPAARGCVKQAVDLWNRITLNDRE